VIAFRSSKPKQPFLQKRITTVPKCDGKTQKLVPVADTGYAVFVPAIGTRTGVVVREIAPRVTTSAVILAHRSPSTLRKEWAPTVPVIFFLLDQKQTNALGGVVDAHWGFAHLARRFA
jgi:hypothetical protein